MFTHDTFVSIFGAVRAGETEVLTTLVRAALREGYALVLNEPGTKKPLCTLTAAARKAADRAAQDAAAERGDPNAAKTRHACGVHHALTEADAGKVTALITRLTKTYGGTPNVGIEPGRSRMIAVDVDTAAERDAFLASWREEEPDLPAPGFTVLSPGARRDDGSWAHSEGGHYWFRLPAGVELPAGHGVFKDESGWTAAWRDRQILVPPSVRAEGPYVCVGQPSTAPAWLTDRIYRFAEGRAERERIRLEAQAARRQAGVVDPVDAWSEDTPWSALLEPDGWTATGLVDTCSCPTWTAPGPHGSPKSATAHDVGCTRFDSDDGHAPLHVWTDNPPDYLVDALTRHGRTLTKLTYCAWRDHGGDESAAVIGLGLAVRAASPGEVDVFDVPIPDSASEQDQQPDVEEEEPKPVEPVSELSPAAAAALVKTMEVYPGEVRKEILRQFVREQAQTAVRQFRHAQDWRPPVSTGSLADELALPPVEVRWRISGLLGAGHNAIVVAGRKTGKTVLMGGLLRALADDQPFLGKFAVSPLDGTIGLFNYELAEWQQREWLRAAGIQRTDRVFVQHLRGHSLPLMTPEIQDWTIQWLREREVQVWLVDPYSRAYVGSVDNGNDEATVGAFLHTLDMIKAETFVEELVMPVHTPKGTREEGEETAIGSQRLEAWPDALWYLTKDYASGTRFLRAEGRDVDLSEHELMFDEETKLLTLGQNGGRARVAKDRDAQAVLEWLASHSGAGTNEIANGLGWGKTRVAKAVKAAGGQIRVEEVANGKQCHYVVSLELT